MITRFNKVYLPAFNQNELLSTLHLLYEGLRDVRAYMSQLNSSGGTDRIEKLDAIYRSLFSPLEGLELAIKQVPKSTVWLFTNPELLQRDNFINHISIRITSTQLQYLNILYSDRLGKLLRFYKHLYTKIYNFFTSEESNQIVKYRKILEQINEDYKTFIKSNGNRKIIAKRQKLDESILKHLKNKSFFYITHIDNLENILKHGIFSHNLAHSKGLVKMDISFSSVQEKRSKYVIDINGSVHDFVPLYINHKTPMLYVKMRSAESNELILLRINPHILLSENVYFTDGNAACKSTRFFQNLLEFNYLHWEIINGEHFINSSDFKRVKSSEVLKKEHIPIEYITDVVIQNDYHLDRIVSLFPNHLGISIKIDRTLFHGT